MTTAPVPANSRAKVPRNSASSLFDVFMVGLSVFPTHAAQEYPAVSEVQVGSAKTKQMILPGAHNRLAPTTTVNDAFPTRQPLRMQSVQTPIIPVVAEWIRQHPGTISLGQGVVGYGPPPEALAQIQC